MVRADLSDFDGMRQSRPEVVPLMFDEDLRLVLEPTESAGMNDAVAVALIARPKRRFAPPETSVRDSLSDPMHRAPTLPFSCPAVPRSIY